jgi:uncharacterized membrane protein (UPF0127 family)
MKQASVVLASLVLGVSVLLACSDEHPSGAGTLAVAFDAVGVTITSPEGTVCEACFWLADTDERRSRGLMHVTDLEGVDGMAFVYDPPSRTSFWMRHTLLDLAISFHDGRGRQVGSTSMVPCPDDVADGECPRYSSPEPFVLVLEVPAGDEFRLGLLPGSVVEVGGPCV